MKYNPKDAVRLLPAGKYAATVAAVYDAVSKSGKEMVVVEIDVWAGDAPVRLKEYITADGIWKLKTIAKALGRLEAFESSTEVNAADYVGYGCAVELTVEEGKNGYDDQNRIKKYHAATADTAPPKVNYQELAAAKAAASNLASAPVGDGDIPF